MTEFRYRILGTHAFLSAVGYDREGADVRLRFDEETRGTVRLGNYLLPLRDGAVCFPREALGGARTTPLLFLCGRTVTCTPILCERGKIGVPDEVLVTGQALVLLGERLSEMQKRVADLEERLGQATIL